MRVVLRILATTLVAASCSPDAPDAPDVPDARGAPDADAPQTSQFDLQELALRWAFANADTDLDDPAVYCVADSPAVLADGGDPDARLLERFRDDPVPVRAFSSCRFEGDDQHIVVDRASGAYGLLFTVSPVRWDRSERAIVPVGFMQGGLWGRGWECVAEQSDADWHITGCDRVLDI